MQDLKNQIIVVNAKWTNMEENKSVNRLYLKARTFENDIIKSTIALIQLMITHLKLLIELQISPLTVATRKE